MTAPTNVDTPRGASALWSEVTERFSAFFGSTAKKGIWALGDQAIVSGTNFVTTVIVGRYCGLDELGLYALAFGILVLLSVCQQSLILNPYTVFSHRLSGGRLTRYAGSVLIQHGLFMTVGVVLLLGAALGTQLLAAESGTVPLIFALAAALPLYSTRDFVRKVLLAELRVRATFVLDFAVAAVQIGGLLALALRDQLSAVSAYAVIALACGVPSVIWFVAARGRFSLRWRSALGALARHWSYGRWVCAAQLTDVIQRYSLHWILAALVGVTATGIYTAYSSIVMVFNPFIMAVSGILLPRAAQGYHQAGARELRRIVLKVTIILGVVIAVACIPVALFGDTIVQRLFEPETTQDMTGLLTLLCGTVLVATFCIAVDGGLCVLERPKINCVAGVWGVAITALITPPLALAWGIEGAALGSLISVAIATGYQVIGFLRVSRDEQADALSALAQGASQ